jgi:nicotinamide-nucleotide adenylyltransferase
MHIGHIHGRFQPFHEEHGNYLDWAARDCDRLIVGITNADPGHIEPETADEKRHQPEHNPFQYYERHRMIGSYVEEVQVPCEVDIMPFPINKPELWKAYIPDSAVHYLDILEKWHEVKKRRLEEQGQVVEVRHRERPLSATEIRHAMRDGEPWEPMVPDPIEKIIKDIDGVERVRSVFHDSSRDSYGTYQKKSKVFR